MKKIENKETPDFNMFAIQIKEDMDLISKKYYSKDTSDTAIFTHWVLNYIYNIDDELVKDCIMGYNSKGISCYVHYEESKELHIIQNRYISTEYYINREDVSDFIHTPSKLLNENKYTKSVEFQNIYNKIKTDKDYNIYLRFFTTTNNKSPDIDGLIKSFNSDYHDVICDVEASFIDLESLYYLYYGKNYEKKISFTYSLETNNKGTFASVQEDYGFSSSYTGRYVITPIREIYNMLEEAEAKKYSLFEENIREYLGETSINNDIVNTLKNEEERKNFIYYNNGITIICKNLPSTTQKEGKRLIPIVDPQIVNGCQTVNSIKKVFERASQDDLVKLKSDDICVMLKIIVINKTEQKDENFKTKVIKYNNKQNAISDKIFVSNNDMFKAIKYAFEKRGFYLLVKQSDKYDIKIRFKNNNNINNVKEKIHAISLANEFVQKIGFEFTDEFDLCVQLDKLLQIILAFFKTGYYAFTKKASILKKGSAIYEEYCSKITDYLNTDEMIYLYILYKKSEQEQKSKDSDGRTPMPYYMLGFLGSLIEVDRLSNSQIKEKIKYIFSDKIIFDTIYSYLKQTNRQYKSEYVKTYGNEGDYTRMIKKEIDNSILKYSFETVNNFKTPEELKIINNLKN